MLLNVIHNVSVSESVIFLSWRSLAQSCMVSIPQTILINSVFLLQAKNIIIIEFSGDRSFSECFWIWYIMVRFWISCISRRSLAQYYMVSILQIILINSGFLWEAKIHCWKSVWWNTGSYQGCSPVLQRVLRHKYQLLQFLWNVRYPIVYSVEGVIKRGTIHLTNWSDLISTLYPASHLMMDRS